MNFENRKEAGQQLAERLQAFAGAKETLVLGLARGGVIVANEIAAALHLPLDALIVKKIGAPDQPELALGAVASSGNPYYNDSLIALLGVSKEYLRREIERQKTVIDERMRAYYSNKKPLPVAGKTLIVVDDGIATGATMKMAIQLLKASKAGKIIVAVPVASAESLRAITPEVDEVICLSCPSYFGAVGAFYRHFEEVTDREIIDLLLMMRS